MARLLDAQPAYLFLCPHTNYGVTLDPTGKNLPSQGCEQGWQLQAEFPLGVQEALPTPINPEPVIRGIAANGYFVWRGSAAQPIRHRRSSLRDDCATPQCRTTQRLS